MCFKRLRRRRSLFATLIGLFMLVGGEVHALTVTDVLGREVHLPGPAKKVLLGEGRFLAVFGVLGVEKPLSRVAGMMNEFRRFDPGGFGRYRDAYPEIDTIPTFGQTSEQTVSVEQAILAGPDVAIFGVQGHGPGSRSRHIIDRLEAAGVPTVFIDFRQSPLKNTTKSVEVVARVLGLDDRAAAFSAFYSAEVARVTDSLNAAMPEHCPSVLLEMRVDVQQGCCVTISRGMFADLVETAGGCNVAKGLLPGAVGELSLEHVIASAPEVYIGTAIGSAGTREDPVPSRIVLGAGVDEETARASLDRVLQRNGFADMPAIVDGRAHALWHHFYNSPLNVYALQKIAQWLHPDLFKDLRPEETLARLIDGFRPVDLDGVYAISPR